VGDYECMILLTSVRIKTKLKLHYIQEICAVPR